MQKVGRFLIVLLICFNVAVGVLASLDDSVNSDSIHYKGDNDDDDEDVDDEEEDVNGVRYIYDHYYENELRPKYQYRRCIDHREHCYSWRHLCPSNDKTSRNRDDISHRTNEIDDDNGNKVQQNLEHAIDHSKVVRWMVSHCPFTCRLCDSHQVRYNVPYEYSMKHEMEQKIKNLPNDMNLFSKINPNVWVDTIRDAMTGRSDDNIAEGTFRSSDAIGIQYLMSTTTTLHNGVSYEQRNAMIQHIRQTQIYYTTNVLPTLAQNNSTRDDSGIE
jgi:hypothetical protein